MRRHPHTPTGPPKGQERLSRARRNQRLAVRHTKEAGSDREEQEGKRSRPQSGDVGKPVQRRGSTLSRFERVLQQQSRQTDKYARNRQRLTPEVDVDAFLNDNGQPGVERSAASSLKDLQNAKTEYERWQKNSSHQANMVQKFQQSRPLRRIQGKAGARAPKEKEGRSRSTSNGGGSS